MPYVLGIDVGFDRTAAAVCQLDGAPETSDTAVAVVALDERSSTVESALYLERDGSIVVGDAAAQHALLDHRRLARGFVARMGDDVPLVIAGQQYLPQDLAAALVTWVVDQARARYGDPAEHVVVTHPGNWGPYRRSVLGGALHQFGLDNVTLLPASVAAAEGLAGGDLLAVYHLGEDSVEASVVRRRHTGPFQLLGRVQGGGAVSADDTLVELVAGELASGGSAAGGSSAAGGLAAADPTDPRARSAMRQLRRECVAAKEALSTASAEAEVDAEVAIEVPPALTPGWRGEVRVARRQFERRIEPALRVTVDALDRAVRSAAVDPRQLDAVLLVGGPCRLPAVADQVRARFPVPIAADADPALTVARGAALVARRVLSPPSPRPVPQPRTPTPAALDEPPPRPPVRISPLELPRPRQVPRLVSDRPVVFSALVTMLVLTIGVALTFFLSDGFAQPAAPLPAPFTAPPAAGR